MAHSHFVDDQQVHLSQAPFQVREPETGLGLGQLVDEAGGRQESHLLALLTGNESQRRVQMGLPGPLLPIKIKFSLLSR
jgi:hypothetical protein